MARIQSPAVNIINGIPSDTALARDCVCNWTDDGISSDSALEQQLLWKGCLNKETPARLPNDAASVSLGTGLELIHIWICESPGLANF